jgi:hypothetical protein
LIHLAYFSSASPGQGAQDLDAILDVSRRNNAADGITGLLCHHDGSFLQFLEGEPDRVKATFDRIGRDPRHHNILKVHEAPISARVFGQWSMGLVRLADLTPEHAALSQNLREITIPAHAEHRQALEGLLAAFRAWLR